MGEDELTGRAGYYRAVCHALLCALAVLVVLVTGARAEPPGDVAAAAEPPVRQLEAFRQGDWDTAYAFASSEIRRLFDRAAFERMVKTGYPEIADSLSARVADRQATPDGHVFVLLKIVGGNGRRVEALYDMVWEAGAWRINGVMARPDPGEDA